MDPKDLAPPLPVALVDALRQCSIHTDMDFLFSGTVDDLLRRLSSYPILRDELEFYLAQVARLASAPACTGTERYTQAHRSRVSAPYFRTGIQDLDELIDCFGGSRVIEISGVQGSGKTALARHLTLQHLSKVPDSVALWLDTTGDFEVEKGAKWLVKAEGQAAVTALERLQVSMPLKDVEEAEALLNALRSSLSNPPGDGLITRCIVIDTVTKLLASRLSAASSQGHAFMTTFMRELRSLARTYSVAVYVINDTSSAQPCNPASAFTSNTRKPALGPSFAFLTDACLWLAKCDTYGINNDDGTTSHVAEVLRSRATQSGRWCTFKIRDGIFLQPS
ncbi:P-loop containing nucleoside triphosphate hydrolase protein [Heliocybe sulcata]|uniref:P-loop containing nucleoside triphosphate hydrolase protein n=1 Tax=Heliocybe sulcata TaxID=5364 RepID=A0A5C3MXR8_9AGAM|nr:P-loop containing nucleoside triphosphate hydrolase protein [Heliocybe sulcata]